HCGGWGEFNCSSKFSSQIFSSLCGLLVLAVCGTNSKSSIEQRNRSLGTKRPVWNFTPDTESDLLVCLFEFKFKGRSSGISIGESKKAISRLFSICGRIIGLKSK